MKRLITPRLTVVLVTVLAMVIVALSACTQQQTRQQDKTIKDYEDLSSQATAIFRQNADSAFLMLDSLEQHGIYPMEVVEAIRGNIYSKTPETKKGELCLRKALTENLYKKWPYGYYRSAFILAITMSVSDNLEGALRVATAAYNRISTETDPTLEVCKWDIMSRIGICRVRLKQIDEAEDVLEKTYQGMKAYTLKQKDEKATESLCLLCSNILADYVVLAQDRMPLWFDRYEEAIRLEEKYAKEGAASSIVDFHKSKMGSLKAQYLGAIGKLKEAKEAFDAVSNSNYYKNSFSVIDKFNYYYFSKQWNQAAALLYDITYYHYHTVATSAARVSLPRSSWHRPPACSSPWLSKA